MTIQPAIRLAGVLANPWVDHDGVDVLLHGVLRTRNAANLPIHYEVTIAIPEDDVADLVEALDQERGQLAATSSAIDDHDRAMDEARNLEVA
jgi:hypothetical protein